jgi:hypothetical protein
MLRPVRIGSCWPGTCSAGQMSKAGTPRSSPRCTGTCSTCPSPDVLNQADQLSAVSLAIAARLHRDGDTVLAPTDAHWFTPFDSVAIATASLPLRDRVPARHCDRLTHSLGEHVRLGEPDNTEPPALNRPVHWWDARGWAEIDDDIVVRPCGGS